MRNRNYRAPVTQLPMPGVPQPVRFNVNASVVTLRPGAVVEYCGRNISGGPRSGTKGVVKELKGRHAVVDMGAAGVWHIPYFFLAASTEAA